MNLYENLKKGRKFLLFCCDFIIWNISYYFSFAVNRDSFLLMGLERQFLVSLAIFNIVFTSVFLIFRMYDKIWRYADMEDFFYAGLAAVAANIVFFIISAALSQIQGLEYLNLGIRTYVIVALMSTLLMFLFRLAYRLNQNFEKRDVDNTNKKRMMIVGAGEATASVLKEFSKHVDNEYLPICIVDDDREKIGRRMLGLKVEGSTYQIPEICEKDDIDVILFSIVAMSMEDRKRILDICAKTNLEVKIIPNIYDVITSKASVTSSMRTVEVEDLLGRETIILDEKKYGQYIKDKNILVTGGGGSIGSELCRQIAGLSPKKLIILDIYENNAYDIQQELKRNYGDTLNMEVEIASIRDNTKLDQLFSVKEIDVVFHAAAHKHVPLMETNPEEAVKNNVIGTLNLVRMADKYKVKKFVQISTDKAVNPTNIMGATKRICEMIVQTMNENSETEFVAVRFGNVLGSNGSVIPLFKEQIKNGGPVTVTHPDIIRFFMTIPEAVSLVLTAGSLAKGGEIFILDMGEPVKIKELAENLIRLSGYIPGKDIEIKYTGLRPGEKLYEEILLDEEGIKKTDSKKIFIGEPIKTDKEKLVKSLENLRIAARDNDKEKIEKLIGEVVPTFKHALNK